MKMERITTENPQNNVESLHNMVCVKNREVYLRGFDDNGDDLNLFDYVRWNDEAYRDCSNDDIMDIMADEIMSTTELVYNLAVGFAETREFLKRYEDAEESGLLIRPPCKVGDTVYCAYAEKPQACIFTLPTNK